MAPVASQFSAEGCGAGGPYLDPSSLPIRGSAPLSEPVPQPKVKFLEEPLGQGRRQLKAVQEQVSGLWVVWAGGGTGGERDANESLGFRGSGQRGGSEGRLGTSPRLSSSTGEADTRG